VGWEVDVLRIGYESRVHRSLSRYDSLPLQPYLDGRWSPALILDPTDAQAL
jgi:hypothetical protein